VSVGSPGALEDRRQLAEVGRHRHQPIDPVGQRRHRRLTLERHHPGDGLEQREAQRVHVALGQHRLPLRFLGRAVLGAVHAAHGDIVDCIVQHLGEPGIHQPQSTIVAEDERGRPHVGVDEASPVQCVERLAGIEAHDQRLRRRQQTTAIQQVAQAATQQALGGHVQHGAIVPLGAPPVVQLRDVGVMQRRGDGHRRIELSLQLGQVAEIRMHQLEHHRALQLLVEGLEDRRLQAAAQARTEAVAPRDHSRRTVRVVDHHGDPRT